MDPGVLIFLLYVMIAHELVCGLMQYRRQAAKPHKRLTWSSRKKETYTDLEQPKVPVSVMERGESVASRSGEETQRKLDVLSGKRDMRAAVDI